MTTQVLNEIMLPGDGDTIHHIDIWVIEGTAFTINVLGKVGARTVPTLAAAQAHLVKLGALLPGEYVSLADEEDQPDNGINVATAVDAVLPARAMRVPGARVTYDVKE